MNFLAHIYLSGNSAECSIGNFIADSVKGKQYAGFTEEMIRGIELHRKIDAFTDTHPVVAESKKRLYPNYSKYAPVIVDVYYDHYLATNWSSYSNIPLPQFANDFYYLLLQYKEILPYRIQRMIPYMQAQNWLLAYAEVEGIRAILSRMAKRTSFVSHMELAANDLQQHYGAFEQEFNLFFPELQAYVDTQLV